MTTVQEQLVTLLNPVVAGGVHPITAPLNSAFPYVTYMRISSNVENTLQGNGTPPINNSRFQIDIWSDTYAGAQTAAQAVTTAMLGWTVQNVQISARDDYEFDVRLFRVSMDYSVWHFN